jgi:hypothetical protein
VGPGRGLLDDSVELASSADGLSKRYRLGAAGYGPTGQELAERLGVQLRAWDDDRTLPPSIIAYQAKTPDEKMASGHVINKPAVRLVITYRLSPPPGTAAGATNASTAVMAADFRCR